jgi:cysteine desulfurase
MAELPIYLDYNATTPVDPSVAMAMLPYLYEHFGNPSSNHAFGERARQGLEEAREQVAVLLGAHPSEIVFTSGGSEANNLAILGIAQAQRDRGRHIVTSSVEHPAVLEPCRALEREGYELTVLPVDGGGRVDPADLAAALRPDTILVTIMHANNEVGTIQPIREMARICRDHDVVMHTDAAQSVGKIPVRVDDLRVHLLTLAGHKLYAPKGVGALYIRGGVELETQIWGASHEAGRRAGTENVLEIAGLGAACALAAERYVVTGAICRMRRDRLWERLLGLVPDVHLNGDPVHCLPNTLSVSFPGIDATALLAAVSGSLAASAGAACHAEGVSVSTVLEAMNVPLELALGTVRLSVGHPTTESEVDEAASVLAEAVRRIQRAR